MPKIYLATPMYGGQCCGGYAQSLMSLPAWLQLNGIDLVSQFCYNESLITRARNLLVHEFLKTDATHLLFIDADQDFRGQDIVKMIQSDVDIIGAIVPKKNINWDSVSQAIKQGRTDLDNCTGEFVINAQGQFRIDQPFEAEAVGTGMMLIKRSVFEKLSSKVNSYVIDNSNQSGEMIKEFFFTEVDPTTHRLLSEDFAFCKLWKQNSGLIHAAPWCQVSHWGTYKFEGKLY